MRVEVNQAQVRPCLTCLHDEPLNCLGIWRTKLKGCVQRLFRRDEPFPCGYSVRLHLRPDRFDAVALVLGQTNWFRKFEEMGRPRDTVELRCSRKPPSAATRDLLQVLFR